MNKDLHAATHSGAVSSRRYPTHPKQLAPGVRPAPTLQTLAATVPTAHLPDARRAGFRHRPSRLAAATLPHPPPPPAPPPGPTRSLRVGSGPGCTRRHEAGRSSNRRLPAHGPHRATSARDLPSGAPLAAALTKQLTSTSVEMTRGHTAARLNLPPSAPGRPPANGSAKGRARSQLGRRWAGNTEAQGKVN